MKRFQKNRDFNRYDWGKWYVFHIVLILILGLSSCTDDDSGSGGGSGSVNQVAPTAGNSGTLTVMNLSTNSLTLSWTKASDDETAAESLTYTVYFSSSDNIGTIADIEANGTAANSSAANIDSLDVTDLTENTTYYFNVIVADANDNQAAYTPVSDTPGNRTVGGSVSGLWSGELVLQNNDGDDLKLSKDGNFTFSTSLAPESAYEVTVKTDPTVTTSSAYEGECENSQWDTGDRYNCTPVTTNCSVSNGSGTVSSENITSITVNCTDTYFFVGDDGTDVGLWKSDGTSSGTNLVKALANSPNSDDNVNRFTNFQGKMFFVEFEGAPGNNSNLWISDGTETGTEMLLEGATSNLGSLTVSGNLLFFKYDDGVNGSEIWKSDGTVEGTVIVKDAVAGAGSVEPYNLTDVNGTLFFINSNTYNLWKSDGTESGTVMVKDLSGGDDYPYYLSAVGGTLFFQYNDNGGDGYELWKSDGTEAGTTMVKDINTGGNSSPAHFTDVDGTLFFTATDGVNGEELWTSDGTESGTVMVKDINAPGDSGPLYLTNVDGTLFFRADDGTLGPELWKSDGTDAGTVMVSDIWPDDGDGYGGSPQYLTNVNGTVFFSAQTGDNVGSTSDGFELYKSDGTDAGTTRVIDINAGAGHANPFDLTNVNGTLYFIATDGTNGNELYTSDGSEAGTEKLKEINASGNGAGYNP